jgi:hypothetical protein
MEHARNPNNSLRTVTFGLNLQTAILLFLPGIMKEVILRIKRMSLSSRNTVSLRTYSCRPVEMQTPPLCKDLRHV